VSSLSLLPRPSLILIDRSDLYSNKDALLSISTFLSLKQLALLRAISKKFNSWLSDLTSFSWKKRIELSFPSSFKTVLKEDAKDQIARLQKFDTLVDSGHQVSFFWISSLLDGASVEVNSKHQLPWSRHLFVIVYNDASVALVDSLLGKSISSVNFEEMKSIDEVFFDIKNHKIGFVNKKAGMVKLYSTENNELQFSADFTCDKFKSSNIIPQIYGDYIIVKDYSKLAWYSLSSGKEVKEITLPGDDGVFLAVSVIEPVIYVSATLEDSYVIRKVDCTLQSDKPMQRVYSASLGIDMDNCGDGVDGLKLIETEHGRMLNVYLLGTGDRAYHAYDLDDKSITESLHFDEFWGYKSIRYNPGSRFYSLRNQSDVLAIMETDKQYEDEKCDVEIKKKKKKEDEDEEEDEDEDEERCADPTEGAYFKFNSKVQSRKWLNNDLFTVKSLGADDKTRQVFFSIAKRGIIGSIEDAISDVFMAGNQIVAFTPAGDFYRITLDMTQFEADDETNEEDEANEKVNERDGEGNESNNSKKRKSSELESDEEGEDRPKKKQKA
jgi:hypothetical protein